VTAPAEGAWELWRQDDNGNRFAIARFGSAEAAEAEQRRFEALGHKQTYWVQRRADP
jgi:Ion transport protein N-terminal